MTEVTRSFCWHQKICPLGAVCPLPQGYIHVLNHEKKCIKSDFKDISLKLATNKKRDKTFLLTSNICPLGLSAPVPGLYTCIKSWKECINSDFEVIFGNLQQMNEVTRHFCWHQNFLPWAVCPCPVLYTCIKSWFFFFFFFFFFYT